MPFQTCWRCLSRPPLGNLSPSARLPNHALAFTTSSPLQMLPPKAKKGHSHHLYGLKPKGVRQKFPKKVKKIIPRGNRPQPGERKAMRKRVVLSNTNALTVLGMENITTERMVDTGLHGQVFGIPGPIIDQLRAVEAFKPAQSWGLFRRPATLIREETVRYGKLFEEMSEDGVKKTVRRVLVGEKGCGKTTMLLQAMTMAFLKDWVVINIPEAQDIVLGHTEYAPIPQTSPVLYSQRSYVAKLLSAISRANPILTTINISFDPSSLSNETPISIAIPRSISLSRLALLGSQDPENAHQIFNLLIRELSLPGRPRLLICIDGLVHAMRYSVYKTPAFKPIHAHDLAIIRWFIDYLSGTSTLPNGGMVLAATSGSNAPRTPALSVALQEIEDAQSRNPLASHLPPGSPSLEPWKPAVRDPFAAYDTRIFSVFESNPGSIEVQRLAGLSKQEARGLLEYWARSGMLRQKISDILVSEKWTLSGGGVVGELERATIRSRI